ncbi:MAG: hypothetical protein ACP8RL_03530 [cyanobacterium endosymbiont of Rhopalodia inflata]
MRNTEIASRTRLSTIVSIVNIVTILTISLSMYAFVEVTQ